MTDGGAVLVEQLRIVHTPVKHDLGRRGGLDDVKDRTEGVLGETKDVNEICIWDFRPPSENPLRRIPGLSVLF